MKATTARSLGVVAACVSAIAAVGSWYSSNGVNVLSGRSSSNIQAAASQAEPLQSAHGHQPEPKYAENPGRPIRDKSRAALIQKERANHQSPGIWKDQAFSLVDQEQKSVIPGCASVAAEFHDIDGVEVLTLRINAGGESDSHAISNAGEQFRISCGGDNYRILALRIDHGSRTVEVSVEKVST